MEFDPESDFMIWRYLGYSYYQPVKSGSKTAQNKIEKNRRDAYYNSPQHLCKSMFNKDFREKGYLIVEIANDSIFGGTYLRKIEPDSCWQYKKETLEITGLKDKLYYVLYYTNLKGEHLNMKNRHGGNRRPTQSEMIFMSDTCVIGSNGTVTDNSILFKPFMGTKQLGASLPNDYVPGTGR